jgi:hypothetical protein
LVRTGRYDFSLNRIKGNVRESLTENEESGEEEPE